MYRSLNHFIMSICAITLVIVAVLTGFPAIAHASSPTMISLPTHCATTYVFFHGTQPATIKCNQQKTALPAHSNTLIPSNVGSCGANDGNFLSFYADQGHIFFCGSGYAGLSPHLTHVWLINATVSGWNRLYPHGSTSGFYSNFWNPVSTDAYPYDGTTDITQVCLQCPPHS